MATLYKIQDGRFSKITSREVLNESFFSFDELQTGKYTVGIQPADTSFLPVYLGNSQLLAEATVIELSNDTTKHITLLGKPTPQSGTSIISGTLLKSKEIDNGRILSGNALKAGEAVPDAPGST